MRFSKFYYLHTHAQHMLLHQTNPLISRCVPSVMVYHKLCCCFMWSENIASKIAIINNLNHHMEIQMMVAVTQLQSVNRVMCSISSRIFKINSDKYTFYTLTLNILQCNTQNELIQQDNSKYCTIVKFSTSYNRITYTGIEGNSVKHFKL